jgi:hypothetical protein
MSSASRLRRAAAAKRASVAATSPAQRARPGSAAPGIGARVRYAFDSSMSRGPNALIWYLGASVALVVLAFAAIVLVFGAGPTHNPITAIYNVTLHTIDTGTQAGDVGTTYTVLNLFVTFAGIFIFSAFIGVLANSIDSRLQELRKGRSRVLETDHTLILGWSESIFMIVSELVIANESRQRARIVILANRDKVEMEDALRERVPDLRGTKVVCRTGSPIALKDLDLVNHREARSVIVLAPEDDDPDPTVIKTILALTRSAGRRDAPYHIVAEIQEPRNLEVARLAGGGEAVILDKGLTVSRLIVQTSRQSGAAAVYQELLDFDGDEIYLRLDASLDGRTYGETLLAYENCAVIGVRDVDGDVKLNPPMDRVILAGDMIIAVAEDDSVLEVAVPFKGEIDESAMTGGARKPELAEATLVLGYNPRTPAVISELDAYARPGARIELVAARAPGESDLAAAIGNFAHAKLTVRAGDTTARGLLDGLDLARFDRVIVMSDASAPDRGRADARVLVTLLHLRDIAQRDGADFTIVSEILDEADRDLASVAEVDDIVVSEQVISYLLAQISENGDLAEVFAELLVADGSEIYMRPVADYAEGSVSFATLVAAARRRGETALGYRVAAHAERADVAFGVQLNPHKTQRFTATKGDRLIVLAEE